MTQPDPLRVSDPDGKFNLELTVQLAALFKTPHQKRDAAWLEKFHVVSMNATMVAADPQVVQGPDGFPYFQLRIPQSGQAVTPYCLSHILDHCFAQGVGVVMFPGQNVQEPGYVFPYGQIACLHTFGRWQFEETKISGLESETLEEKREVLTGIPSEEYYPKAMWPFLGGFMHHALGVPEPKIGLMLDPKHEPSRSLVVNISRSHVQDDAQLQSIGHALQWFMLPGQVLMFLPEGMDDTWMAPLLPV